MNKPGKPIDDPVKYLQEQALNNFDDNFWLNKAIMLKKIIDDKSLQKNLFGEDSKTGFLEFEMYATKMHCYETLLRLLIITKKNYFFPLIPLIRLSFKKFHNELDEMKEDMDNYFSNQDEFFKKYFYPYKEIPIEQRDESIRCLKIILKSIVSEYDEHMAYNVFKHGFYGSLSKDNHLSTF